MRLSPIMLSMKAICIYSGDRRIPARTRKINERLRKEGCVSEIEELHDFLDIRYLWPISSVFMRKGRLSRSYLSFLRTFCLKHAFRALVTNLQEESSDIIFASDCQSAIIMTDLMKKAELHIPVILLSSDDRPEALSGMVKTEIKSVKDIEQGRNGTILIARDPDVIPNLISPL